MNTPHRQNVVGAPVQGDDFFDREAVQRRIWRRLKSDNLLLLAPRRVGKTSLMLRLKDTSEPERFRAAWMSVSDIGAELAFVERLYQTIQGIQGSESVFKRLEQSAPGKLLKRLGIKSLGVAGASVEFSVDDVDQWQRLGEALTKALKALEGRWLLMVDELPVFVLSLLRDDPTGGRARRFLNWFRELRINPEHGHVRWILAGSIGLDTVAQIHNLGDTINDLHIVRLDAFEPDIADRFLIELGASNEMDLTPALRAQIMERVEWPLPFYLQLVFSELFDRCDDLGLAPSSELVDQTFEGLLDPSRRGYFDYWRQRLNEQLDPANARFARALLDTIAKDPQGVTKTALSLVLIPHIEDEEGRRSTLEFLLRVLENDGYTARVDDRHRFRSPLLRASWLRDTQ